jgi:hypothetical protein
MRVVTELGSLSCLPPPNCGLSWKKETWDPVLGLLWVAYLPHPCVL